MQTVVLLNRKATYFTFHDLVDYDTDKDFDPFAKQSLIVKRSRFGKIKQDGDVWYETVFRNTKNDKKRVFFVSQKTGRRMRDEVGIHNTFLSFYVQLLMIYFSFYSSLHQVLA